MNPTDLFHESWKPIMNLLFQEPLNELRNEILPNSLFYPEKHNIFRVFKMPVEDIKVVILGQDPYHGPKQANGLAFAVNREVPIPPSLRIIQSELGEGIEWYKEEWRTLEHWESQGVFLLNTALTVEAGKPASHLKYWEDFIKRVVNFISSRHSCVWLLWGRKAQVFSLSMLSNSQFNVDKHTMELLEQVPIAPHFNYILTAAHPAAEVYSNSPAGFIGCNHFTKANKILMKQKKKPIIW